MKEKLEELVALCQNPTCNDEDFHKAFQLFSDTCMNNASSEDWAEDFADTSERSLWYKGKNAPNLLIERQKLYEIMFEVAKKRLRHVRTIEVDCSRLVTPESLYAIEDFVLSHYDFGGLIFEASSRSDIIYIKFLDLYEKQILFSIQCEREKKVKLNLGWDRATANILRQMSDLIETTEQLIKWK